MVLNTHVLSLTGLLNYRFFVKSKTMAINTHVSSLTGFINYRCTIKSRTMVIYQRFVTNRIYKLQMLR